MNETKFYEVYDSDINRVLSEKLQSNLQIGNCNDYKGEKYHVYKHEEKEKYPWTEMLGKRNELFGKYSTTKIYLDFMKNSIPVDHIIYNLIQEELILKGNYIIQFKES